MSRRIPAPDRRPAVPGVDITETEAVEVDVFITDLSVDALDVSGPLGHGFTLGRTSVGGVIVGGPHHGARVARHGWEGSRPELGSVQRWTVTVVRAITTTSTHYVAN